jgi:hypothetical protein
LLEKGHLIGRTDERSDLHDRVWLSTAAKVFYFETWEFDSTSLGEDALLWTQAKQDTDICD